MRLVQFVSNCLVLVICNNFVAATLTEPTFWVDVVKIRAQSKNYYWIYFKEVDERKTVKNRLKKAILMEAEHETILHDYEIQSYTLDCDMDGAVSWLQGLKELNKFLSEKQGQNRRIILCPSHEKFKTMKPFLKKLLSCRFEDYEIGVQQFPDVRESEFFDFVNFFTSNDFTLRAAAEIYDWHTIAKKRMVQKFFINPSLYSTKISDDLAKELKTVHEKAKDVIDLNAMIRIRMNAISKEESFFQRVARNDVLRAEDFNAINAQEKDNA